MCVSLSPSITRSPSSTSPAHFHSLQVDRLMELHFKYLEAVQQADKRIEGEKHVSLVVFLSPPNHSPRPPTAAYVLHFFCDGCSSAALNSAGPISLKGLISMVLVAIEKPHPGENCTIEKQPGLHPSVQTWALHAVRMCVCMCLLPVVEDDSRLSFAAAMMLGDLAAAPYRRRISHYKI